MKRVKLVEVTRLTGKPFKLPKFDDEENLILDDGGVPETYTTKSLIDILEYFVLRGQPRGKYTKLDALRTGNIYRSLQAARGKDILELDEPEHDWLKSKLGDDAIGVRMFTHDVQIILDAVDNFVKAHEASMLKETEISG